MDSNKSISAQFIPEENNFVLSILSNPVAGGSSFGSGTYSPNTFAPITAEPLTGYEFV